MSRKELSKEEINKRLIRLRNLEYLYTQQREQNTKLRRDKATLTARVIVLEQENKYLRAIVGDLKLQVEELRTIVFGKKKHPTVVDDEITPPKPHVTRTKDSYRRPIPKDEEVTETKNHSIDLCNHCHTPVTTIKVTTFYEEDIPLPTKKSCIKHVVEKGYCTLCRKWNTSIVLPAHRVILGRNIQKYICYLIIVCRLSYTQTQQLLYDTYNIAVSEGEIAKILSREARNLHPSYEQLKERIRSEPGVHLDETGWKILTKDESSYAWVMSGTHSKESVFLFGESRGKGNVEKLLGSTYTGYVVSDDYVAYKSLTNHQLCFAHPLRKFRDLALSGELTEEQRIHNKQEYCTFASIYTDLEKDRLPSLREHYTRRFTDFSQLHEEDCRKMRTLKTTLLKNIPKYLTCLTDPSIPLTNNQAERSLRHLVLKRKISFGSLTKKTADNLSILMSVIMSLKQRHQDNFFGEYLRV